MVRLPLILMLLIVCGCTATNNRITTEKTGALFEDSLFTDHRDAEIESPEEIFALNEAAKSFIDSALSEAQRPKDKIDYLTSAIFDRAYLGLAYSSSETSIASETFNSGLANCLSMTIMTYSLAAYAGLSAQFLSVDVPEYWTRRDGFSLINGHVNLALSADELSADTNFSRQTTVVDFDPQASRRFFRSHVVDKADIIALFYNNRAADAILNEDYSLAYAYLKAAAKMSPLLDDTWVNLGVLYRLTGEYKRAEKVYKYAARLRPQNYTIYENLAILYRLTGRTELAHNLERKVAIARRDNPFYHFILAEVARSKNEFKKALGHYNRAIRLDQSRHEFYFGLGVTFYELGDIAKAKEHLNKAANHAPTEEDRARYAGKLTVMQTRLK